MVGQVGSPSKPGKITLCKLIRCPGRLRAMGSNANLGKECVSVGKKRKSHLHARALLVFVLHGQKTTTEDTRGQ